MPDQELDCKGLNCPMPIVKLSLAMKRMDAGQTIAVEATDPSFKADVEAWAKRMGQSIVEFSESESVQRAVLEKK